MLVSSGVCHDSGKADALAFALTQEYGPMIAYSGDCGFDHGSETSKGLLAIASDAKVQRLVLTHYSGLDSAEAMTEDCLRSGFTGEIIIAKDNDVYGI